MRHRQMLVLVQALVLVLVLVQVQWGQINIPATLVLLISNISNNSHHHIPVAMEPLKEANILPVTSFNTAHLHHMECIHNNNTNSNHRSVSMGIILIPSNLDSTLPLHLRHHHIHHIDPRLGFCIRNRHNNNHRKRRDRRSHLELPLPLRLVSNNHHHSCSNNNNHRRHHHHHSSSNNRRKCRDQEVCVLFYVWVNKYQVSHSYYCYAGNTLGTRFHTGDHIFHPATFHLAPSIFYLVLKHFCFLDEPCCVGGRFLSNFIYLFPLPFRSLRSGWWWEWRLCNSSAYNSSAYNSSAYNSISTQCSLQR